MNNRRQNTRHLADAPACIFPEGAPLPELGRLKDVSSSGACVWLRGPVDVGSQVSTELHFGIEPIRANAIVVRTVYAPTIPRSPWEYCAALHFAPELDQDAKAVIESLASQHPDARTSRALSRFESPRRES